MFGSKQSAGDVVLESVIKHLEFLGYSDVSGDDGGPKIFNHPTRTFLFVEKALGGVRITTGFKVKLDLMNRRIADFNRLLGDVNRASFALTFYWEPEIGCLGSYWLPAYAKDAFGVCLDVFDRDLALVGKSGLAEFIA